MPARRATLLALSLAGALAIAGCGDDGPVTRDDAGVVRLRLDEYRILPQRVRVPSGRFEIVATNRGVLTHNVAIVSAERRPGQDEVQYARTATAHPGQTVRAEVRLKPGKYRMVCSLANHDNLGQYGELIVG
jgi:plastocyanin